MAKWIAAFVVAAVLGGTATWARTARAEEPRVDEALVNAKIDARLHQLLTGLAQRQAAR